MPTNPTTYTVTDAIVGGIWEQLICSEAPAGEELARIRAALVCLIGEGDTIKLLAEAAQSRAWRSSVGAR